MKTSKEILLGLEFRLKGLKTSYEVLHSDIEVSEWTLLDFESKIDEVESLIEWIKEK